ncbi:MAG: hypothetical protein QXQ79_00145 [Candidatus Nanoarchaeia archaeon]
MGLFFKKRKEEIEEGELPPLPPLPGEEESVTEKISAPLIPEVSMKPSPVSAPAPAIPSTFAPAVEEKATVFIRLDKYKETMRNIQEIETKLTELKETLDRIASIKNKEAEIIDGWAAMLAEAKTKLDEVSAKLIKPEV